MSTPKPKFSLPLSGRTFERRQGCWNCTGVASEETSLQHWLTVERPAHEARIAEGKQLLMQGIKVDPAAMQRFAHTPVNERCPCGSGRKYKVCHRHADEDAARVFKTIEGIEKATEHVERFEAAIRHGDALLGQMALCNERSSPKYGTYVSNKYLCDRWSGAQGASVARAGGRADDVPEEMVDKIGDGN
jgi:hypothetical protein